MDPPGLIAGGGESPPELGWRVGGEEIEKLKSPAVQQKLVVVMNAWAGLGGCSGIEGPGGPSPGWADAAASLPRAFAPRNLPHRW